MTLVLFIRVDNRPAGQRGLSSDVIHDLHVCREVKIRKLTVLFCFLALHLTSCLTLYVNRETARGTSRDFHHLATTFNVQTDMSLKQHTVVFLP